MRHRWHVKTGVTVLLTVAAMAVPAMGEAKGDRAVQGARQESGAARGIVKAVSQAVLYAQIPARVNQVPYKEGQRFAKGATLVQLECDKYQAELAAAERVFAARWIRWFERLVVQQHGDFLVT